MAYLPVQIDLKTGRPLRSNTSKPLYKRHSMAEFGNFNADSSEQSDRSKPMMGMGDIENRVPQFSPPQFKIFHAPLPLRFVNTPAPLSETEPVHVLAKPSPSSQSSPLKTNQTPSRVESERIRRKFVAETVKQRQTEQVQKKLMADVHLKRLAHRTPLRRAHRPSSRSHRPRSRSATFVVDKPTVLNTIYNRGDIEEAPKAIPDYKSVSSSVVRTPKMEERQKCLVNLNKAARLRLERFKK